jgi:hypothetical protein
MAVGYTGTMNNITVAVDLNFDTFSAHEDELVDGADLTHLAGLVKYRGVTPDRLVVVTALGPGGGNPFCHATFTNEADARKWFAYVTDDNDPAWFDENRV